MSSIDSTSGSVAIPVDQTALVIVDMQNDFASAGGMMDSSDIDISDIRRAVPRMAETIAAARAAGIPVIYVKMAYQPDLSDFGPPDSPNGRLLHRRVSSGALIRDTWGSDVIDELAPEPGDISLYKTRFSGFYGTDLDDILRRLRVTNLVVIGCTTSICVESTIRDAYFRDYDVILLEDCCAEPVGAEFGRSNHDATIHMVETTFGTVSSSAEFVSTLERSLT